MDYFYIVILASGFFTNGQVSDTIPPVSITYQAMSRGTCLAVARELKGECRVVDRLGRSYELIDGRE